MSLFRMFHKRQCECRNEAQLAEIKLLLNKVRSMDLTHSRPEAPG